MPNGDSGNGNSHPTVGHAFLQLLHHPAHYFIRHWNWKSALFSAGNRGTIFFVATMRRGRVEMSVAVLVEITFSVTVAGVYAAFTQAMRFARPEWLGTAIVALALPSALLGMDYLAHLYTGMHHMRPALTFATALSVVSSLFNLFVMRRGALIVGEQGDSLLRDLKRMPVLIAKFVIAGPLWLLNFVSGVGRTRGVQIVG